MQVSQLPLFVSAIIVIVDLLMAALLSAGLTTLAVRPGVLLSSAELRAPAGQARLTRFRRLITALIIGWIAAALLVTFGPLAPPSFAVIAYVTLVTASGYALITRTQTGRQLLAATPQSWLIGAQAYRAVGAVFLIAAGAGVVPEYFARPAGWGDIATGLGAILVAWWWIRRRPIARAASWAWNSFGLLDLIIAVGIGSSVFAAPAAAIFGRSPDWLARATMGFEPTGTSIFPVVFPLALIPTVAVPLGALLHLLSLRKLRTEHHPASDPGTQSAETTTLTAAVPT